MALYVLKNKKTGKYWDSVKDTKIDNAIIFNSKKYALDTFYWETTEDQNKYEIVKVKIVEVE